MKVAGDYTFDLPIERVWDGIFDARILAASLPGCENLERDGDVMRGELVIKIGPVKGKFKGTVEFSDIDAPNRCSFNVDGKGTSGFVKATAKLELESSGDQTILRYESDSKIGGRIASVGQRLLKASARAIAKQSLESLNETLRSVHAAEDEDHDQDLEETVDQDLEETRDLKPKSQAAFAAGVAKEVAKDLIPAWLRIVLVLVVVGLVSWLIYVLAT